jgi:enoyl-CoA hydratase/carnithine racemase
VSSFGPWSVEQDGPLTVVTLDSPPVNLYDRAVDDGLRALLEQLTAEPPRGVLFRAEGKVWTGGVDVKLFAEISGDARKGAELWERGFHLVHALEDLPCPVVFAAHGLCLTWGLEIALACDILLAAESAKFGLVERVVGLTPSIGGPQRLAERVGPARAKDLIMTGELFSARTLESWGAVSRVFADDEFDAKARAYAMDLATGPTRAHAATKAIIKAQKEDGARAADAMVPAESGALFATEDLQAAVASFLKDGPGKFQDFAGR